MIRLYFDYIDPSCRVMEFRVRQVARELDLRLELIPFEVRPPGDPAISPTDPRWQEWWGRSTAELREFGIEAAVPERIPLTRKAHELRIHAIEKGHDEAVHEALWEAFLERGIDLGRIDLLVEIGVAAGLDRTETKAVLDVDRWTAEIVRLREASTTSGIRGVPAFKLGPDLMEGVHPVDAIREFVGDFESAED